MRQRTQTSVISLVFLFICVRCFNPFDEGQYDINWGGPVSLREGQVTTNGEDFLSSRESVVMITKDNEKYRCILPKDETLNEKKYLYNEPDPEILLESLLRRGECSYRLDSYWTYELCHGRHVKQFHELKAGVQDSKVQEYYLGKLEPKILDKKSSGDPKPLDSPPMEAEDPSKIIPSRKINGQVFPYYKVVMDNGTACDLLGNKPRTTNIIYMCAPRSSNEIISVKEIHTCHYEVEVFTPLICANPAYSYREKPVHHISCHSMEGSPDEPRSYSELMEEKFSVEGFLPPEDDDKSPVPADEHRKILPQPDNLLTASFLSGDYCLVGGGSGWWKYEFCYGKQVTQFHQEANGPRINILLGKWVENAHISWKKDKWAGDGYIDHFYSGGDVCDLTGKPRSVVVRLKCKESTHLQEVALSLTEPSTCEYILRVESPIICPLLEKMDEHGLFVVENL
ncbi:endoplasmic reticulum lectin 1-like [Pocillopora damicornis]|uniref:endoplasmic reticulum lectin 1-like n=1 Tax=Pocillopora damicornis TaxID=46731 RepID=UPI000F55576F|nr:endoplasmic reticulum lectin 1-like [Pocillopora damicornis]